MNPTEQRRLERLESIARRDLEYIRMMQDLRPMERAYQDLLVRMTDADRDIICEFVSQCEEISYRMLELACRYMQLADE